MKKKSSNFFKGSGFFIGVAVYFFLHRYADVSAGLSILSGSIVALIIWLTLEKGHKEVDEKDD